MTPSNGRPTSWWGAAEAWASKPEGPPPGDTPWQQAVARSLAADLGTQPGPLAEVVAETASEPGVPGDVVGILQVLVGLRDRSQDCGELGSRALSILEHAEPADAARAGHYAGLAFLYSGRMQESGDALLTGLEQVEESPRRYWMLGSLASVLISEGAWTEARRVLQRVAGFRTQSGDAVGTAITAGRQASLELELGDPSAARGHIAHAISAVWDDIPRHSQLRLATIGLTASAELGAPDAKLADDVKARLDDPGAKFLRGLGALALLRAFPHTDEAAGWLAIARSVLTDPTSRAEVDAWAEHFDADGRCPEAPPTGLKGANRGAFRRAVLCSERALAAGERDLALRWLDHALRVATATNTPVWIEEVDRRYATIDPVRGALTASRRFSGLPTEQLERTVQEDVTIVFNDLVGFTKRSQHLSPEEVMRTIRSLFEVTAPVLAKHRVRPLQYLGDGLLAVAQGPDHAERGRAFAVELVARCGRMSRVRRARGEALALTTRAGVASGPVVLGLVGSFAKLEHLAIGRTTNLAARLQGKAEPGECVWMMEEGDPAWDTAERVPLKGFEQPVRIVRIQADPGAAPE